MSGGDFYLVDVIVVSSPRDIMRVTLSSAPPYNPT